MMKKLFVILVCYFVFGCAPVDDRSTGHGLSSALTGLGHLLLSPFQIAAGLLEGITAVPYYLSTNLSTINEGLVRAQARIALEDTYQSAYGKRLSEVPEDGNTGAVFSTMKQATQFFQNVLRQYGVGESARYILTSIEEDSGKYILLAVVHRPANSIQVIDKYDNKTARSFTIADRLFYEPFREDVNGNSLDTIIDWAGLSRESVKTQKAQAILITLAANAVLNEKKSTDYWEVEKRWLSGEALTIVEQRANSAKNKMGI